MPAPSTPTLVGSNVLDALGPQPPALIACRSKKNAWIMFFGDLAGDQLGEVAASMRLAVSKSTCAPSTAAARMPAAPA